MFIYDMFIYDMFIYLPDLNKKIGFCSQLLSIFRFKNLILNPKLLQITFSEDMMHERIQYTMFLK